MFGIYFILEVLKWVIELDLMKLDGIMVIVRSMRTLCVGVELVVIGILLEELLDIVCML